MTDDSDTTTTSTTANAVPSASGATVSSASTTHDSEPKPATYYHLAKAVLYREFLIFVRYPANAIGGIVVALFFFGVLFYGGRLLTGRALTDSIEGIIVGYFLWTLSVGAYSSVSNDLGSEVQWGTLERHITTPFGFAPVALLKGVAKIVRTFLTSAVILAAMLLLTGTQLSLSPFTVVAFDHLGAWPRVCGRWHYCPIQTDRQLVESPAVRLCRSHFSPCLRRAVDSRPAAGPWQRAPPTGDGRRDPALGVWPA